MPLSHQVIIREYNFRSMLFVIARNTLKNQRINIRKVIQDDYKENNKFY